MTFFSTKLLADITAEENRNSDSDWSYNVAVYGRGFVIEVFDEDDFYLGTL